MNKIEKITIVQEWIPHYRLPFFDHLNEVLLSMGISLELKVSKPSGSNRHRIYSEEQREYINHIARYEFQLFGFRLSFGPKALTIKDSNLVVYELARRNLELWLRLAVPKKSRKTSIWLWGHGYDHHRVGSFSRFILLKLCKRADGCLTYTAKGRDFLISNNVKTPIFVIQNSLYTSSEIGYISSKSKRNSKFRTVGFIGDMSETKQFSKFVELATIARENAPDLVFKCAGTSRHNKDYFSDLNIYSTGPLTGATKLEFLSSCDILFIPDAIGLVAIDALVHRLPILTLSSSRNHGPEYEYASELGILKEFASVHECLQFLVCCNSDSRNLTYQSDSIPSIESMVSNFALALESFDLNEPQP